MEKQENEISASQFAEIIGCSRPALNKMFKGGKLTEGRSYVKDKKGQIFINVDEARRELSEKLNHRQIKNEKLFEFLGLNGVGESYVQKGIKTDLNLQRIREEIEKEHLRKLVLENRQKEGELVERAKIERSLGWFGAEMRNMLSNFSDKYSAVLWACQTETEFKKQLSNYIEELNIGLCNVIKQNLIP